MSRTGKSSRAQANRRTLGPRERIEPLTKMMMSGRSFISGHSLSRATNRPCAIWALAPDGVYRSAGAKALKISGGINAGLKASSTRTPAYTSRITGIISGRREVFFTIKRFRSWRIFSLIMP